MEAADPSTSIAARGIRVPPIGCGLPSGSVIGRFRVAIALALILLLAVQADAIVGGGSASNERIRQSLLPIVGSRGNFCTGAVISPKLVLRVANCVQP